MLGDENCAEPTNVSGTGPKLKIQFVLPSGLRENKALKKFEIALT
jgi:hypothetical protein